MVKLTVAGYGFVGHAVFNSFSQTHDVRVVDPRYNQNTISDTNSDGVIVCVSTPSLENGECDISNVLSVLSEVDCSTPVLIKSTVSLEGWNTIRQQFPEHDITFSPEFLRASTADIDFAKQTYTILGGKGSGSLEFWDDVFAEHFGDIEILACTPEESILIKYAENSFLAVKVGFFNHLYDLSKHMGVNFETVRHHLTRDDRILPDHSYVPGPDNQRGWGGHCFPKDTSAILKTCEQFGYDFSILNAAVKYNRRVRK